MSEHAERGAAVRVGLVGAGRGGTTLLELLLGSPGIEVVAVADPDPAAPGLPLARSREIPVVVTCQGIFEHRPDIVMEVTGRREVWKELERTKPPEVELVGSRSARVFWQTLTLRAQEARRLEKAETVRRLAAGLSHTLKNLFTVLHGRGTLLLQAVDRGQIIPAELRPGLKTIVEHTARGNDILKRLRGFTREAADEPVRPVDVNNLVGEVLALAEPLIRGTEFRSGTIEVRQKLGAVAPVAGRSSELLEVLVNLVLNGIEAMPQGGTLMLETARAGSDVLIHVRDTGPGIPERVRDQLFTPFFTTKPDGTGLGLSITQEIVRRHGGKLAVDSKEGEGACFTVRLPTVQPGPIGTGRGRPEPRQRRALVVDDDRFVRDLLAEILSSDGWAVESAAGGEEALARLTGEPYDLVLADVVLPDISGWEVVRAAKAHELPPAVIILSGWVPPDDPILKGSGADAFFQKPIRVPDLIETVRSVMTHRTGRPG